MTLFRKILLISLIVPVLVIAQGFIPKLNVDNLQLDGNTLSSTSGNIVLDPTVDINLPDLTANRVLVLDGSKLVKTSTVTSITELDRLDGVTSSLCGISDSCSITNKTINGSSNTITNISLTTAVTGILPNANTTATSANTASAIVARDGSGNFTAGTITAAVTGNASTATALAANPADCGSNTFAQSIVASGALTCANVNLASADVTGILPNGNTTAASANTNSAIVARDSSGNFSATTITAALTGNASTATALAANPADCGPNTFAQSIVAAGTLTCAAVTLSSADVTGTLTVGKGGTGQTATGSAGDMAVSTGSVFAFQTPYHVAATLVGANVSLGTAAVSAYTEIADAGLTLTPQTSPQVSAAAGTMCSGTNAATTPSTSPTTCAAGSESAGISVTIPYANRWYRVCAAFGYNLVADSGAGASATFEIIETPTNAQTLSQEGGQKVSAGGTAMTIATGAGWSNIVPVLVCSNFYFTVAATKGFRVMYEQSVTNTPTTSQILISGSSTNGQRDMYLTVDGIW